VETHDLFCFDERPVSDAAEGQLDIVVPEIYLHAAGGALNIAYGTLVMEEVAKPGSVKDTFADRAATTTPLIIAAGGRPGVHSDTTAEQGTTVATSANGAVGCGYAALRAGISHGIGEHGTGLVMVAAELRPELFEDPTAYNFAHAVVGAHSRLAAREGFAPSGRPVVMNAAYNGAKMMLVDGDHKAKKGIINLVPNTTFDSDTAFCFGAEAYNQDSWAVADINDRLRDHYPFDGRQQQIGELIDTLGTMLALGVDEVATRRPDGHNVAVPLSA
jgi:hypothetical protein